jgi:glycerophosphoryl diester phosphodiesterase
LPEEFEDEEAGASRAGKSALDPEITPAQARRMWINKKQFPLNLPALGRQIAFKRESSEFYQRIVNLWTLIGIMAGLASATAEVVTPKIIIAHRGASGYLPEHTLPGKALAHAMGADYLEQDLVLSKDGIPVVLHDIVIDTVTDVAKRFPERKRADDRYYALDFTMAELKTLQVTERFDHRTGKPVFPARFPQWQATFQIPTLEEELQFIQGLNRTTGREAGIYPEIKSPAWHREQGQDLSRIVLKVLDRYGYRTKADKVFLQCFDYQEVKRLRTELGYRGRLIQLLADPKSSQAGTDFAFLISRAGLAELAKVADGIGPSLGQLISGKNGEKFTFTDLVQTAHEFKLLVHPYTIRTDDLPRGVTSGDQLFRACLVEAGADGVFTDQPDRGVAFLRTLAVNK